MTEVDINHQNQTMDYISDVREDFHFPSKMDIYNLINHVIAGDLPVDVFVGKLTSHKKLESLKASIADRLADVMVLCDIELSNASEDKRAILAKILKAVVSVGILPRLVALERLETDICVQAGVITDRKLFTTIYNRVRTKLYFKQRKYNLLREENEGFAMVITQLYKLGSSNTQRIVDDVINIVGRSKLDPNRVLDLFLEVFEYNSREDSEPFLEFLTTFYNKPMKITQLILLKLSFFTNANDQTIIPQSFYRLMAILIHREIIDLDEIYNNIKPSDSNILEYHQKLVDEARLLSRRYAMALVGEEKQVKTVLESLTDDERFSLETDNHKINLCAHLMDIGDWDQAIYLAKKLPEFYCLSHRRIATSACDLISYLIDPIYRSCALPKPLDSRIKPIPSKGGLEQIVDIGGLKKRIFPMLTTLGPFLSVDPLLLIKVIRLLNYINSLERCCLNGTDENCCEDYQVLDIINDSVLPSMSLTSSNSSVARELWSLIRNFNYNIRYKLYHNWRDEGSNPVMLRNRGRMLLKAKHHMKRMSKETIRLTGRHMGKLCHSNPVIVINYILSQVMSYDNLISTVIDAMRFLTPLASDALIYCILEILCDPNRNRTSLDGMAIAQWLTSISSFSSGVILRFRVDFTSFLEYIAKQLKSGNSLNLILFSDLIQKMTGIETIEAITDDRLDALMGGDVLRTEAAYFHQVKNTRKPSARLREALIESRLAMPLCISIAQLRDSLFYSQQGGAPLKLIGKLYDQCQQTLVQYGMFLSMNLSIDDYINFLPSLSNLMTEYKLGPDSAFFLARPMILYKIKSKFNELCQAQTQIEPNENGRSPEPSLQARGIKFVQAAQDVIDPIALSIQPSLLEKYGTSNLNAKLFVIFWTFSMCDLEVPVSCYEREILRLKNSVSELSNINEDDSKRRKERDRYNNLINKLKQEQADQVELTTFVKMYLTSEKNNLFCEKSGNYDHVYLESRQFVQLCPFARSILTDQDAVYSARFLLYLHELKVEEYPTIICLDRLLCDLTYMMGACTEGEANHYGRFLANILKTTAYWHSDSKIYEKECENYPGSIIDIENSEHITYNNYRDICYKWHYRLTRAFTVALESNNYVQIRNALIVMIKIIDYYPAIKHFGKSIGMKVEDVRNSEKESRQDLYALATAYAGKLDEKKPHLIPESSFHQVEIQPAKTKSTSSSTKKKVRHT